MPKRLFTIFMIVLFVPAFILAQSNNLIPKHKRLVNDSERPVTNHKDIQPPANIQGGAVDLGITTDYDYFSNSVIRDQIAWSGDFPVFANMVEPFESDGERHVVFTYNDGNDWQHVATFGLGRHGWPQIDVSKTGSAAGTIGIVGHVPCQLALWDGVGSFLVSEFDPDSDPSLQFSGDNVLLASTGNRVEFQFYFTTDFGVSFTNWGSMSDFSPTPIFWETNGGVEVGMSKSPDEMTIGMFGTNANEGHVYDGVSPDSADNLWLIASTDGGGTWTGQTIAVDGDVNAVMGYHTPNFAPIFENFGQVDAAIGNDGVWHFVANGYGAVLDNSNTVLGFEFPVLYYNSTMNQWKSISVEAIDTLSALNTIFPGNDLGQNYPGIAVSDDGQVVYACWTGPQLTQSGEVDTTNANGFYWMDMYHAFSLDGGATWTYGGVAAGDPAISESFAHPVQHLRINGQGEALADVVYLADLDAGVNVFGEGNLTDNPLMWLTVNLGPTAVGDDNTVPNQFTLEQNYPNPFNPSTTIKYTLAERTNVSLKVYDVLGNEVATLVNATQDVGAHQINFDAANLASGLYFYTIKAGNFTSTKKMMLLK